MTDAGHPADILTSPDYLERAAAWNQYEITHPGADWEAFKAGWEAARARLRAAERDAAYRAHRRAWAEATGRPYSEDQERAEPTVSVDERSDAE